MSVFREIKYLEREISVDRYVWRIPRIYTVSILSSSANLVLGIFPDKIVDSPDCGLRFFRSTFVLLCLHSQLKNSYQCPPSVMSSPACGVLHAVHTFVSCPGGTRPWVIILESGPSLLIPSLLWAAYN